jgi:hypothetical protein
MVRHTKEANVMADAAFVLVTILFFALSIGYVAGCNRLTR